MRDTANILLGCDLRQAEVVDLFNIMTKETNTQDYSLLVKLVKGAIDRELDDTTDPEGLFWVATPNVFILMNFFATVGKPFYKNAISSLVKEIIRQESSEPGFPSTFAYLVLSNIANSIAFAPPEILEVCAYMHEKISQKFPGVTKAQAIAPFIIFRGFASILTKPQSYELANVDEITPDAKCTLLEISKSLICNICLAASSKTSNGMDRVDSNNKKLRDFLNDKNTSIMEYFLTSLVDKEATMNPPKQQSEQTLLVRVDASGTNKNQRIRSLIQELKISVEKNKKVDVDIHVALTYSSELLPEASLSRRLSNIFVQPKIDENILEFAQGKLIDEVAFKITFKDTICLFHIPKAKVNLKKIKSIIHKIFFTKEHTIKYMDAEGDYLPINTNEELLKSVDESRGLTVKLFLTTDLTILPKGNSNEPGLQRVLAEIERRLRVQYPGELFFRESFVISDPSLPDNPLVYINDGFEKLTLYPSEEIIGKNCRFLQGKSSNTSEVNKISKALKEGKDVGVELVNYRKDGKPFWNRFHIYPLRGETNKLTHFVAVQQDITHIKQRSHDPKLWTPTDVAEWLSFMRIPSSVSSQFENFGIDGNKLLAMKDKDLEQIGVRDQRDKEKIGQFITYLIGSSVPKSSNSIPVKVYFEGDVKVMNVKPTVSLKDFTLKVQKTLQLKNLPVVIQYENQLQEKLSFISKTELHQKLQESKLRGQSFKVWVALC